MSWEPELEELRRREAMAREMGGPDKVKRQHDGGRLTVRERVDGIADPGTFHEIGTIAGKAEYDSDDNLVAFQPANCVMGRAEVEGRPVVICGDDFTVRGGSADATIKEKPHLAERMANEMRLPIIRIIEGSGGGGSVRTIETTGRANLPGGQGTSSRFDLMAANLGSVPVVALGLGSVAGLGAARMAASHYSIMTKETSAMFVAGPPVVKGIGQDLTKQELGGWKIQTRSGGVDDAVDTEEEAFQRARQFLSYLPGSIDEMPPRGPTADDPERRDEKLISVIPKEGRRAYRMRPIIESVVDEGSFFEMGRMFGRSLITGLARVDGHSVALMASDPMIMGGAWTSESCQKLVRFIDMAETFHLPVIYLADCPGFAIGLEAEKAATIRHGVRAMAAINQTTTPWCAIVVRNAFGVAGGAHVHVGRHCTRYAWPSGRWGSLPLEGGIEAAYRAEIDAADDKEAELEKIEKRLQALRSPFRTAEAFWVEEIIDPRDTRPLLADFARLAVRAGKPGERRFSIRP
jgi:acetyl-CoA carboxylase carboxyltransferase component